MKLGAFSYSLSVKDLAASRVFYGKLGFVEIGGKAGEGWLILKSGNCVSGLFQDMFERNMLTFNPGWNQDGEPTDRFTDIGKLQAGFKQAGLEIQNEVDKSTSGPASFMVVDPDGNPLLFAQHV